MVEVRYEKENKKAVAYDGDRYVGECTYSGTDDLMIIDHTQVSSEYTRQGVGRKLVMKLVDEARKAGMKIMPLCPFAKKVFEENQEAVKDVWKK